MYLTAQQQKRIKPFAFYLRYKWFCTDRSDTESNTVNAVMDSPEVRKSQNMTEDMDLPLLSQEHKDGCNGWEQKQF